MFCHIPSLIFFAWHHLLNSRVIAASLSPKVSPPWPHTYNHIYIIIPVYSNTCLIDGLIIFLWAHLHSRHPDCNQIAKNPMVIQQVDRWCAPPLDDAKVGRMHTWAGQDDIQLNYKICWTLISRWLLCGWGICCQPWHGWSQGARWWNNAEYCMPRSYNTWSSRD